MAHFPDHRIRSLRGGPPPGSPYEIGRKRCSGRRSQCIMKSAPLQKIEAGCCSLRYSVMERTSSRAGGAPAEVQRLSRRNVTPTTRALLQWADSSRARSVWASLSELVALSRIPALMPVSSSGFVRGAASNGYSYRARQLQFFNRTALALSGTRTGYFRLSSSRQCHWPSARFS